MHLGTPLSQKLTSADPSRACMGAPARIESPGTYASAARGMKETTVSWVRQPGPHHRAAAPAAWPCPWPALTLFTLAGVWLATHSGPCQLCLHLPGEIGSLSKKHWLTVFSCSCRLWLQGQTRWGSERAGHSPDTWPVLQAGGGSGGLPGALLDEPCTPYTCVGL